MKKKKFANFDELTLAFKIYLSGINVNDLRICAWLIPGCVHDQWFKKSKLDWLNLDTSNYGFTFKLLLELFPTLGAGRHQMVFDIGNGLCLKWFCLSNPPTDNFNICASIQPLWHRSIWAKLPEDNLGACRIQEILEPVSIFDDYVEKVARVEAVHKKCNLIINWENSEDNGADYQHGYSSVLQWGRDSKGQLWIYDLH